MRHEKAQNELEDGIFSSPPRVLTAEKLRGVSGGTRRTPKSVGGTDFGMKNHI
jgi:hypothetical protein